MKRSWLIMLMIPLFLFSCAQNAASDSETTEAVAKETEPETESEVVTEPPDDRPIEIREVDALLQRLTDFRYVLSEEPVSFSGRWFEKEIDGVPHHVTVNAGSELYFAVYGTDQILVNFTEITVLKTPYFAVSVDGNEPVRQLITEPSVGLPDEGAHVLRIVADGLTESENKYNGEIGFAFRDVDPCGGVLVGIRPTGRTIMFFGDSITEGVRALNMNADSDGNSASHSYPWYCAKALGAVPINVGFAASGTVGAGSFAPCLTAIDWLSATRPVEDLPEPDVIVLAHGHNDVFFKEADVAPRYRAVLDRLAEKYPDSRLFVLIPFSQTHADTIRACCEGRDFVTIIETADWNPSTTDGVHLNAVGTSSAGNKLAKALRRELGDAFFD